MPTLNLPRGEPLTGDSPLVILGPNGSGKTQFASQLANSNNADFINALRNIQLADQLTSQSLAQVRNELNNQLANRRSNYWQIADEIQVLFSKLLAEDAASAIRFRDAYKPGSEAVPDATVLTRVRTLWASVFPGRSIAFADGAPKVTTEYAPSGAAEYAASRMSDGERVALYLAGRVLNASTATIVVDEPEVHFHSRLAVRFWDALEKERPDLRFVYVTHDLSFALSRHGARYVLVKPNQPPQVLGATEGIPDEVTRSVLGAASFSVYAQRIIFCEGTEGGPDYELLSAWAGERRTAIIPVGSCQDVMRSCAVLNSAGFIAGITAEGQIDRDYWPDSFLTSLPSGVQALRVHEIESLYCLPDVVGAIAEHLGKDGPAVISEFEHSIRVRCAADAFVNSQALHRAKSRMEPFFTAIFSGVKANADASVVRSDLATKTDSTKWQFDAGTVFDEELVRLKAATASGAIGEVLALFPGKPLLSLAAEALEIEASSLVTLVNSSLKSDKKEFQVLRLALETALAGTLPARLAAVAAG